jgi:hypothetical protein
MAIETRDQFGIVSVEWPATGTHMTLLAFWHDLVVVLFSRTVCVEDGVTLNAVYLVFPPIGLDGLIIRKVALAAFGCGQRLHRRFIRVGRVGGGGDSQSEHKTNHPDKTSQLLTNNH